MSHIDKIVRTCLTWHGIDTALSTLGIVTILFMASLIPSGCVEDNFTDCTPEPPRMVEILNAHISLQVNLPASAASRAIGDKDLEDGDESEYAIAPGDHHLMIFFNKEMYSDEINQSFPSVIMRVSADKKQKPNDKNITLTVSDVFAVDGRTFGVDIVDSIAMNAFLQNVAHCYIILNSNLDVKDINGINLGGLRNMSTTDYSIKIDGTEYFTMTTSVYLNSSNSVEYAFQINPTNIFSTPEEAKKKPAIIAWVERMAAKHTLKFASGTGYTDTDHTINGEGTVKIYKRFTLNNNGYDIEADEVEYQVKVLGYGVNATEKAARFFKKIDSKTYYLEWNDAGRKRCYWTDDLHYNIQGNVKNYPHQFRKALETDTVNEYHGGVYKGDKGDKIDPTSIGSGFYLTYRSFNEFTGGEGNTSYPERFYSHENTYNDEGKSSKATHEDKINKEMNTLFERGCYTAGTHLIIAAQLNIHSFPQGTDLYYCQNNIFYNSADSVMRVKLELLNKVVLPGGASSMRLLAADWKGHTGTTYSDDANDYLTQISWQPNAFLWIKNGNRTRKVEVTADNQDLTLIPAEISGGDGELLIAPADASAQYFIAPQKTDGSMDDRTYEVTIDGMTQTASMATELTYNQVVSLFHKFIGTIQHFNKGYMYYAVPILHNTKEMKPTSWRTVGDIGVVRNNWYEITVNKVTDVGRPVDDPDQPIIPYMDVNRDYLNVNVRILDWHNIRQEGVPMQ